MIKNRKKFYAIRAVDSHFVKKNKSKSFHFIAFSTAKILTNINLELTNGKYEMRKIDENVPEKKI